MTPTLSDADRVTRDSFLRLVVLHCRMRGLDPDPCDLDQWLAACWPLVEDDMRPDVWALEYIGATRGRGAVLP
jgi:hypothetical protein